MSTKHFVCQGAICECKFGTAPDTLKVLTHSKHYINDRDGSQQKLIATNKEVGMTFKNNSFGVCKLQPIPGGYKTCEPALTAWENICDKKFIEENGGGYPLLEDSLGNCSLGGSCIKITFHGQTAELTPRNIKNANREVLSELFPFWDVKEVEKKIWHHTQETKAK